MAESWQELVTSHTQLKLFLIVRLYNRWVPYRSYIGSQFVFFFLNAPGLYYTLLQQIFGFYLNFRSKVCFSTAHVMFDFALFML